MEVILPHLYWLSGYESCFNSIVSLPGIVYEPTDQLTQPFVPYTYHMRTKSAYNPAQNDRLPAFVRHWTICQTISFILQLETTGSEQVSSDLQLEYEFLGFNSAYSCIDDGPYCGVKLLLEHHIQIQTKSIAMYPLQIFYIVPFTPELKEKFHALDFRYISTSPYFLQTYRISYPFHEIMKRNLKQFVLEKYPLEICYMCQFCDPNRAKYVYYYALPKSYPYQDFTLVPSLENPKVTLYTALANLYTEATEDGKRLTYYKLALPYEVRGLGLGYYFEDTSWNHLTSSLKARSTLKALKNKPSIDEIILSILLEETQTPLNETVETWTQAQLFPAVGVVMNVKSISIMPIHSTYFNFITCHLESHLNLLAYVQPFHWNVWLFLLASIWLTAFTIPFVATQTVSSNNQPLLTINHYSIFLALSLLLTDTVVFAKEFYGNRRIRLILSLWLLASIILTNAYKGHHFAQRTAPSKNLQVKKFQDLTEFKIFTKRICDPGLDHGQYCSEFGANLINWLVERLDRDSLSQIISNIAKIDPITGHIPNIGFLGSYDFETKSDGKIASLLPQLEMLPNDETSVVYQAIHDCNKLAYVEKGSELKSLIRKLPTSCSRPIYVGNDKLFEKTSVWYIQASGGSYLMRRFRYLEESGIYHFWRKWIDIAYHPIDGHCAPVFRALSLQSNTVVIFFILLMGIVIAALIFLCEIPAGIKHNL
ncbi:unnamed protein product [Orchesella dallaii]|uniref:Uncharacterized protein n=1 Tax=Orchesella dallaii TaxID=48710 RepID=A0ABP1SA79_9HEXA